MKVGFLSDIHVTHNIKDHREAVDYIHDAVLENDVEKLFIAGDLSSDSKVTLDIFRKLRNKGVETYGIFGNHEYLTISYDEAQMLNDLSYCNGETITINNTSIICIDGFFDYSFITDIDNEFTRDLPKRKSEINKVARILKDPRKNRIGNYSEVFEKMETRLIRELKKAQGKEIIMMLHYVPHEDFLIYKSDTGWTSNNARMGSTRYHKLAKEYGVSKVVFGHTHYTMNKSIDGVDYYCNPVGYRGQDFQGSLKDRIVNQLRVFEIE